MIYYRHFGLSGAPFQFTPSPKVLYSSPSHSNGLAALEGSLTLESAAITLLTGPSGSGKTTLAMAMLARHWGRSRVVYLANPSAGSPTMLREILGQLGTFQAGSPREATDAFSHYLSFFGANSKLLILFDEAHYLSDATCDQIADFLNRDRTIANRLSLALIGQPELLERIASERHRRLQELTASLVTLKPLPLEEAIRYVEYRLAAFNGLAEKVFAPGALEYLLEHAEGLPRRINILCHNAMLMAHAAQAAQVTKTMARMSVSEFEGRTAAEAVNASSQTNKNSSTPARAGRPDAEPVARPPAPPAFRGRIGMGIGLLLGSVVVMSGLWLAITRSEAGARSGFIDAEEPAIFSDDLNGANEGTSPGTYRLVNDSPNEVDVQTVAPVVRPNAAGGKIEEKVLSHAQNRRQVTIYQRGAADSSAPTAHNPGLGS